MIAIVCSEAFTALATPQLDAAVDFYRGLFGCEPHAFVPAKYAEFKLPGLKLALFQPQLTNQAEFTAPNSGAMSLCLEVANLEGAIAHLTAMGYPPIGIPTEASHGREIYAYDLDGNRLILHESG